ncbi:MAG: serine hydrolase [Acidimicrobiales bacterium]|nr:serine hydrolase [Acidimicrobiales bacterium]MDG2219686.1 serine hydrolase [Acidimicrobiales bacterium]
MQTGLDTILSSAVDNGDVPGVVAMVVDPDGVLYEGAFGERSLGSGAEMTLDTVGAIFSMTKPITGAAAMQLVERGQLDLDAPAGEVCEQLADLQVLEGFSGDGEPILRPANAPVTLRNLLTHTSGFAYDIWNADMARYLDATGTPAPTSGQRAALDVPLMFDPGSQWEYGIGIDWVGQMIEQVSGMSLGEYFAENLTGPLGMTDTAFAPTESMTTRAATVHARLPDGRLAPLDLTKPESPEFEPGGGGLHSTMIDYSRFIRMILNEGELDGSRVLAPQTVALMAQNHMGELRVRPLPTQVAAYSRDAEFFPGSPKSWGLSFQVNEEQTFTGRSPGTLMWAGLANSYFWIDPTNGIGGCYLSQIFPFVDPHTLGTFLAFETGVYASHQG